jgi:AmmeMemoRadiSam system protein B
VLVPYPIRRAAVAGSWYPQSSAVLADAIDRHLAAATSPPSMNQVTGLIAPHAGLMYSGPVAAFAYEQLRNRPVDTVVLVGPSHFVAFDGVSIYPAGGFETPLGVAEIDVNCATELERSTPLIREMPAAHEREHALEMQLPFLQRVLPSAKIVPLLMGEQTPDTVRELGSALERVLSAAIAAGRRMLLIASTDLSHYHDAQTAWRLDAVVIDHVERLDADGLQALLDRRPEHACGGGPAVAVMRACREAGARRSTILKYADSGDVSGDKTQVVGYLAAAIGHGSVADADVGAR